MRLFWVISFILFGAILFGLRVDNIGNLGNVILNIIGVGFMLMSVFIGNGKRKNKSI
ncbi:serine kinase [Litchfieldia alkalitelluris]|uniref:serine kinase n=1 Tax=Litchfieldia alkalitelluris TaxID=304268 RepID=UPI0009963708|nr:serine kinase [Litchfieldia alkalitelluris]